MANAAALVRLALASLDGTAGPDVHGARALLRAALEIGAEPPPPTAARSAMATLAGFGAMVQASPRAVRRWIAIGRIPRDAVTGKGRGLRIDVERALAALKSGEVSSPANAGAAYVTRRRTLRAVR